MRPHSFRVQAIVVSHRNYSETDRFITLISPDLGKISALAKGVRKMNSRKSGHLLPFTLISVQLIKSRGASFLVDQVSTITSFQQIYESLNKTIAASCVMELAERFSLEEVENRPLFELTVETLRRIARMEDFQVAKFYFDLHLLEISGYRPQLRECVFCRSEILPQDQYFSYKMGGVICPSCERKDSAAKPITMRTLKYLRYYQQHSFADVEKIGWPDDLRFEGESILTGYHSFILERKTNSQQFKENVGILN